MLNGTLLLPEHRDRAWTNDQLRAELFYDTRQAAIFGVIRVIVLEGGKPDAVTVGDRLRAMDFEYALSEPCALYDLAEAAQADVAELVRVLERLRQRRQVFAAAREMLEAVYTGDATFATQVSAGADTAVGALMGGGGRDDVSAAQAVETVATEVLDPGAGDDGIETGIGPLDNVLGGIPPGNLVIIGARPSVGKSSLVRQIAEHVGHGGIVALFSLEMTWRQIATCMIVRRTGLSYRRLSRRKERAKLTIEERDRVRAAAKSVRVQMAERLRLIDVSGLTVADVIARARRLAMAGPLAAVMVDYLGLLADLPMGSETRTNVVQRQTAALKQLAGKLNCPVIALSQLNRESPKRRSKWPTMTDLRDSGSIEQDADIVLAIHRETYFEKPEAAHSGAQAAPAHGEEKDAEVFIIVLKDRVGLANVAVRLLWCGRAMEFRVPIDDDPGARDARYEPPENDEARFEHDADDLPF